jgi:RimJ/RimL family protein N-acetyltransferase
VLDLAFGPLGLTEVVASVDDDNTASIRLLTTLGMSPRDPIVLDGRPVRRVSVDRSTLRRPPPGPQAHPEPA